MLSKENRIKGSGNAAKVGETALSILVACWSRLAQQMAQLGGVTVSLCLPRTSDFWKLWTVQNAPILADGLFQAGFSNDCQTLSWVVSWWGGIAFGEPNTEFLSQLVYLSLVFEIYVITFPHSPLPPGIPLSELASRDASCERVQSPRVQVCWGPSCQIHENFVGQSRS